MKPPRVRFAPSPTGRLHIGGLRTALFNYLFTRKNGGVFILRIEDTDQKRLVPESLEDILRNLAAYGLTVDEGPRLIDGKISEVGSYGPYTQSKRLPLYRRAIDELIEQGSAYPCFCTVQRLSELRTSQEAQHLAPGYDGHCRNITPDEARRRRTAGEPCVIRFRTPKKGQTVAHDLIRGDVTFKHETLEDVVLFKTDGFPTYHLANVVDDHAMDITHVIRAEEWLPSLPLHLLLYAAFTWTPPEFAHLPLILGPTRKKLSKRDGDTAAADFLNEYVPMAMVNFISLLGWNPKTEQEYYASLDVLVKDFDLAKVNKAGAIFDVAKLKHLNRLHMRALPPEKLATLMQLECTADEAIRFLPIITEKAETFSDVRSGIAFLLAAELVYEPSLLVPKAGTREKTITVLTAFLQWLPTCGEQTWRNAEALKAETLAWVAKNSWTNSEALWPLRVALSGLAKSPDVFAIACALQKVKVLERIQRAIEHVKNLQK